MDSDDHRSLRPFMRAEVSVHPQDGRTCSAVLANRDGRLVLEVHNVVHGISVDPAWRSRSDDLASQGQTVDICHDGMRLLSIDAIKPSRHTVGSSRHIAYGAWPGAKTMLAGPSTRSAAW